MYRFANTNCIVCHKKLPKTKVEPSGEVDLSPAEEPFKIGNCPNCGAPQRLVEMKS